MVSSLLVMLLACGSNWTGPLPPVQTESSTTFPWNTYGETEASFDMAAKVSNVAVIHSIPWPGGGRELTVRVVDDSGAPVPDPTLVIETDVPAELELAQSPVSLAPGYTGLVLLPGAGQGEVDRALAFLATRPDEEWTAIYLASEPMYQLAGFTRNRERLERTLAQVPTLNYLPAEDLDEALSEAADLVEDVGGKGPRRMRAAVVFTDEDDLDPSADLPILRVGADIDVQAASSWIDETAAQAHWTVSVCGPPEALSADMIWEGSDDGFTLDATLPEEVGLPCDVTAIGPGLRQRTDTIAFRFDATERAIYDQIAADGTDEDFTLSVDLGGGRPPVSAVAHLRGNGSFWCGRKNYVLQLDGEARTLFEESFSDEYLLLSMCLDQAYVEQHLANLLMTDMGAFRLKFRYVELKMDDQTNGVYLLLEKTREELVRDQTRARSVARRGYGEFVGKWSYDGDIDRAAAAALATTDGLDGLQGQALQEAVDQRMDLEGYLRWLALNSAIQNGDYIDETWFISAESVMADGGIDEYFVTMAWDADDILTECHGGGVNAWVDPWELAFCAEDAVDYTLLEDAETYERFADTLESVLLDDLDPLAFEAAAVQTGTAIMPFFDRPGVSEAMTELGEPDPAVAKQAIIAHLWSLVDDFETRHDLLLGRIAEYRAAN